VFIIACRLSNTHGHLQLAFSWIFTLLAFRFLLWPFRPLNTKTALEIVSRCSSRYGKARSRSLLGEITATLHHHNDTAARP
jgi:hypothetical protein